MQVRYDGPRAFRTTTRDPQPLTITVETSDDLPQGTHVSVVLGGSFGSVRGWSLRGVTPDSTVTVVDGVPDSFEAVYRARIPESYRNPPKQYRLVTARVDDTLTAEEQITFDLTGTLSDHVGVQPTLSVWVRPPDTDRFKRQGTTIPLEIQPGDPHDLNLRARPEPGDDESWRAALFATDACQNPVPEYGGTVTLSVEGDGSVDGLPDAVQFTSVDDGRYVLDDLELYGKGPLRITVRDTDRGFESTSGALFPQPLHGWGQYFGGIHFHTEISHDGDRHIRDAYTYARDYLQLDVVAATDHTPGKGPWLETTGVNETFDDAGSFVTIPAWEWSAVPGHANIYMRSPDADAGPDVADPMETPSYGHFDVEFGDDPEMLPHEYDWPEETVLVPHHTNARDAFDGKYWRNWDWSIENDRIRSVEIVQGRGNFEADQPDETWGIRSAGFGSSVQDAFEQGYRLGFVAGTDNHRGFPTVRPADGPTGLTCFLAEERTRDAIWTALNERRTYATSGVPIRCHYTVNDHLLGSEARLEGDGVSFSANLYGTAPIERVEIISDRDTVWSATPDGRDVRLSDEPLPAPAPGDSAYYYLRLRQTDGHRAWVSPVWLDRA